MTDWENTSISPEARELTSKMIEISILANASHAEKTVSVLKSSGFQFSWQQAANWIQYQNCLSSQLDLVLYDARLSQITLDEAIDFLLENNLTIPLLVINGESKIPAAVAAVKAGATDYIPAEAIAELPQTIAKIWQKPASIRHQTQSNAENGQQLQKLIAENADGIIVVDLQGIVQFVNPAALELLSKPSAELIGESLGFPVVNGDFLEVDLPVSPNKILVAQMRVSQIQWQGAKAFVVTLRDITQLKQAEEERVKLLAEARAANRAKDEFLAILSHELRTPLNPIVGWSQILARGNLSQAQIKQGAEIIQRNATLQTRLIEDILDISRIIRGKLNLQPTEVNLLDTINDALDTVSLAAQAKSIQIETELEGNIGSVKGDPTRLQQIIWNLLSNAVKFTPKGGKVLLRLTSSSDKSVAQERLHDAIELEQSSSYAQIQVIDSGKGIAPEFVPYVFDYFRQAEGGKSRSEGGLGLGLAIVRRIVELHGGEVTASSPGLGKGATFSVFLPLLDNSNQAV